MVFAVTLLGQAPQWVTRRPLSETKYFGIGMAPLDITTTSNMFGVGKERIRQMKEAALSKLRDKFANQLKGLLQ